MSAVWQDNLRRAWSDLARHPVENRLYRTRRLSTALSLDVHVALRAVDDAPCLVIEAPVGADALFEVGGMRLAVVAGERGPLTVLSLEDRDRMDIFTTVCADAVEDCASAGTDALPAFLARLDAWRRFLRERRSGLSREETVGLIGELIILEAITPIGASSLPAWAAPDDGLHDFRRNGHAMEVKTSLGPSSTVRISSLDQLDTAGLRRLDLVHVRLIEAPDGRTLGDLIGDISRSFPDETSRRAFQNALLRRGLMPDDTVVRATPRVQVRSIEAYSVREGFPRLARSSVPSGVAEAVYSLEIRAIAGHAVDSGIVMSNFGGSIA